MNKQKFLALLLATNLLMINSAGFCASTAKINPVKEVSNQSLKGGVSEYKAELINKNWWERFNDPILAEYVIKAASANQDLKIATLRVSEYQALVQESFGREFPVLSVGANTGRQKTSDNVQMGTFKLNEYTQNSYAFPLNVNYELDLWRKNRDRTVAQAKVLEAVKYDEKAAYISLISTVATVYFNIMKTDKFIDLQKQVVEIRKNKLDLVKEKVNYGLGSYSEILKAEKTLAEAQGNLTDLKKQQSVLLNQLAVLTGDSVENSASLRRASVDEFDSIKDLPTSITSETILNRPDILKAEAELQKARIDVKLARKNFLPSINITGQFGFNSNSFSRVFSWDSYIASVGAGIAENLFTGGQRLARLKGRKIRYEEMLENYQKTVLTSFQEVNDSLVAIKSDSEKNQYDTDRLKSEKGNFNLINIKYQEGMISYLDTLEYKEKVPIAEMGAIQSKTNCLVDSLSLYKSVGGKL